MPGSRKDGKPSPAVSAPRMPAAFQFLASKRSSSTSSGSSSSNKTRSTSTQTSAVSRATSLPTVDETPTGSAIGAAHKGVSAGTAAPSTDHETLQTVALAQSGHAASTEQHPPRSQADDCAPSTASTDHVGIAFSSEEEEHNLATMHLQPPSADRRPTSSGGADVGDYIDMYGASDRGSTAGSQHADADYEFISLPSIDVPLADHLIQVTQPEPAAPVIQSGPGRPAYDRLRAVSTSSKLSKKRSISPIDPDQRDRYGFRCATNHIDIQSYTAWSRDYEAHVSRRRKKWHALLKDAGLAPCENEPPKRFPPPSVKVQRFVRKGIPPEFRGEAWWYYAGGPQLLKSNPHVYADLLGRAQDNKDADMEIIERDLHRTFPDNSIFRPPDIGTAEPPLISSLRRVLRAAALHRPAVGYCQSLNFLAAMLLLFLDEERAFWMLQILCERHLPGSHDRSLEGANVDQAIFILAVRESLPACWTRMAAGIEPASFGEPEVQDAFVMALSSSVPQPTAMEERRPGWRLGRMDSALSLSGSSGTASAAAGPANEIVCAHLPPVTLVTAAWFMSCFVGQLPTETCLRVWDLMWYEGSRTLFRVALTLVRLGEPDLLKLGRPGGGSTSSRSNSAAGMFSSGSSARTSAGTIEPMEVFQIIQNLPKTQLDPNKFVEECFKTTCRAANVSIPPYAPGRDPFLPPHPQPHLAPGKHAELGNGHRSGTAPTAAALAAARNRDRNMPRSKKLTQAELERLRHDVDKVRAWSRMRESQLASLSPQIKSNTPALRDVELRKPTARAEHASKPKSASAKASSSAKTAAADSRLAPATPAQAGRDKAGKNDAARLAPASAPPASSGTRARDDVAFDYWQLHKALGIATATTTSSTDSAHGNSNGYGAANRAAVAIGKAPSSSGSTLDSNKRHSRSASALPATARHSLQTALAMHDLHRSTARSSDTLNGAQSAGGTHFGGSGERLGEAVSDDMFPQPPQRRPSTAATTLITALDGVAAADTSRLAIDEEDGAMILPAPPVLPGISSRRVSRDDMALLQSRRL